MPRRSWFTMFRDAFRGIREGVLGERAFVVHIPVAIVVVAAGAFFGVSTTEWLVLVLCIALVVALRFMLPTTFQRPTLSIPSVGNFSLANWFANRLADIVELIQEILRSFVQ